MESVHKMQMRTNDGVEYFITSDEMKLWGHDIPGYIHFLKEVVHCSCPVSCKKILKSRSVYFSNAEV